MRLHQKQVGVLAFLTIDFNKLKVANCIPIPGPIPIAE